jgi:aerobic carbon-monoxide dehydrogenase large subunit
MTTTIDTPVAPPRTRLFGQPIRRVEDRRFVTGQAQYVGNIELPNMVHAAFVRSQVPHGIIRGVDLSAALELPGVVAAVSGVDLQPDCHPIRSDVTDECWQGSEQWPLAVDRVRFVGEAVAAVVSRTRYDAEDAVDLIMPDIDWLTPVASIDQALDPEAPKVHEQWRDNCFVTRSVEGGDVDAAFADAPRTLSVHCVVGRHGGIPMETRGCIASYDKISRRLTLYSSHQMPHVLRTVVARLLGLPENSLRVIAPDVGGGFGIKSNIYPEELVVCMLSMRLGRPVKWIEDRREHLLTAAHARDHRHELEVAYDDDGVMLGVRAKIWVDCGAYSLFPWTAAMEPGTAISMIPGPYRIRHYSAVGHALATNKTPCGPYRGIARVPATFTMERAIDQIAHDLDLTPAEVRRRNLVRPDEFPYLTVTGNIIDSGSFMESVDELERLTEFEDLRAWQENERARGRRIGIGLACFTEQTGHGVQEYVRRRVEFVFGYDKALLRMDPSGSATLLVGIHSHGQGLETTLAQIAADQLGLPIEGIRVVFGDTDMCPYGNGTFGSRSAVLCGGATELAARKVADKLREVAGYLLDAEPDEIELADSRATIRSDPDRSMSIAEVAHIIHLRPERLPAGADPVLEAVASYDAEPGRGTYSNGIHLAMVEVDEETGVVKLLRYAAVDDCGRMINPMIVEGQIHGAVCQGIGGTLYESFVYDEDANPLSTTFLDYLLPGASDIPNIEIAALETPSPFTINGVKGTGESGTIGPPASIAAAVEDAIWPIGRVFVGETPITPEAVLAYIDRAREGATDADQE